MVRSNEPASSSSVHGRSHGSLVHVLMYDDVQDWRANWSQLCAWRQVETPDATAGRLHQRCLVSGGLTV